MKFIKFFHKLFRPNCECMICAEARCEVCEELKRMLYQEQVDKARLLTALVEVSKPERITEKITGQLPEPIHPKTVPWPVKQAQLEREDRARAIKKREQEEQNRAEQKVVIQHQEAIQSIAQLETELGIIDTEEKDASQISKTV